MPVRRTLKPIDQLRAIDLETNVFWRFATDVENVPGQDETTVVPVRLSAIEEDDSLFVVADFVGADGSTFVGLVQVESRDPLDLVPCAIVTNSAYGPLPPPDFDLADSLIRFSETQLGFPLRAKFPATYKLRGELLAGAGAVVGMASI